MTLPTYLSGERIQGRSDDSSATVADFTEDFSETTPTTWTEDSSSGYANNLEPYKSSTNGLWFDMDYNSSVKTSGTLDLANAGLVGSNVSDTQWTFRFKFNVTSGSGSGTVWVGLSDNTNAVDTAQRFIGCRIKDSSGFSCGADNGGQAMNVSNATNGGSTSISDATDYYVTVERKTATLFTATIRTGSHTGTVLGTGDDTTISSSHDDLRYFKVMNHMAGSSGQIQGYIYDLEIYDDTNTLSIAKDKSTITNVPYGTRYEETDTRKVFRRKGGLGDLSKTGCIAYYPLDNSWANAATGSGFPDGIGSNGDLSAQASAGFDSTRKLGTHAAQFPADADYSKTTESQGSNFDFTSDFSVTVWFYRDDSLDGGYHAMVSKREGSNSEMNFIVGTDNTLSCYINRSGVGGTNFASTQTFANATWYHAAVTRSGNTLKYYIDGVHTTTGTIGSGHSVTNTAPFALGAVSASGGEGFDGNLDDVSVWERALTDAEIASIYNAGTGATILTATDADSWVEKGTA